MTTPTLFIAAALFAQSPAPASSRQAANTKPADALQLQVTLDRAGFSPGVIDGRLGMNTRKALDLYQQHGGQTATDAGPPLTTYTIGADAGLGPFVPDIPKDLVEQAKLQRLGYRSALEAIAERYHSTPQLLQRLNPNATFVEGEEIHVPNVEPLVMPETTKPEPQSPKPAGTSGRAGTAEAPKPSPPAKPDVVITVSKGSSALTVKDADGKVIFYAPVTTGSEHDPLPIGEWNVKGVQMNPTFNYNPDLFWDADPSHTKAKIPPGPNNPVGLVWIDLSKEHYGIHGSPEPSAIGRTESHGCVRLTNWDALKLAGMVKPGTRVIFTE
jgi:lipoprotein-anchoring transpeptidase ErfK/SrfK